MYKEVINQTTVMTVLDTRRKTKSGLYPIKVQVIDKRIQKYFKTGKELDQEDWEKLPNSRVPELIKIRNSIKASFDLIVKNAEELISKGEFSFDMLNIRLGKSSGVTLNKSLQIKIESLKEEKQIGTMDYYKGVLSNVEKYAGKDILFENITPEWLRKYENHLIANNHTYATIGMYMRGIRAMMNIAKKDGLIKASQYPFGKDKYEIKTGESRKKALTLEQIAQIANYSDGNETTEFYRDLWLFIYLCNGINTADLVKLKFNQIVDGEIYFIREKTKRTSKVVKEVMAAITPEMQRIIDRWGNEPKPDNLIFPLINNTKDLIHYHKQVKDLIKRINKRTKKIGEELGIGKITTYVARHTIHAN